MAIQLSAYLWLRNNDLAPMTEDWMFRKPHLTEDDKTSLKCILDEIELLHADETTVTRDPTPMISDHVMLLYGVLVMKEGSSDLEKTAAMYEGIFQILKNYDISPEIYSKLGRSFAELGLQPLPETNAAIDFANKRLKSHNPGNILYNINWEHDKTRINSNP